jgi:hypothetical protein
MRLIVYKPAGVGANTGPSIVDTDLLRLLEYHVNATH